MYNLIIDDNRTLEEIRIMKNNSFYDAEWIITRKYIEFYTIIKEKGIPNKISFDHDLADFDKDKEYTGKDCAQFLIDYCIDNDLNFPDYRVHSANPAVSLNISSLVENFIRLKKSGFFK